MVRSRNRDDKLTRVVSWELLHLGKVDVQQIGPDRPNGRPHRRRRSMVNLLGSATSGVRMACL